MPKEMRGKASDRGEKIFLYSRTLYFSETYPQADSSAIAFEYRCKNIYIDRDSLMLVIFIIKFTCTRMRNFFLLTILKLLHIIRCQSL